MDESTNGYHLSFFKPTTPQARANRNMVIWLVSIWFIAVFGFQILLLIVGKPTPEPAYTSYQNVRASIEEGDAGNEAKKEFARAVLSVLGKTAITPAERQILDKALSSAVYQLLSPAFRNEFISDVRNFKKIEAETVNISDPGYIRAKKFISEKYGPLLDLSPLDARSKFLPLELRADDTGAFSEGIRQELPVIMKKYLIHNQSFLTDYRFLGFPFHYFYTAIFLLILFIALCLVYCIKTDSRNARMNMAD